MWICKLLQSQLKDEPRWDMRQEIDRNEKYDNLRCFQSFVLGASIFFLYVIKCEIECARWSTKCKWYAWLALRMQIEAADRWTNKKKLKYNSMGRRVRDRKKNGEYWEISIQFWANMSVELLYVLCEAEWEWHQQM